MFERVTFILSSWTVSNLYTPLNDGSSLHHQIDCHLGQNEKRNMSSFLWWDDQERLTKNSDGQVLEIKARTGYIFPPSFLQEIKAMVTRQKYPRSRDNVRKIPEIHSLATFDTDLWSEEVFSRADPKNFSSKFLKSDHRRETRLLNFFWIHFQAITLLLGLLWATSL